MSLDDVHLQTVRFTDHFAKLAIPETVPVGVSRIGVGRCDASFRLKAIPHQTSGNATDGGGAATADIRQSGLCLEVWGSAHPALKASCNYQVPLENFKKLH